MRLNIELPFAPYQNMKIKTSFGEIITLIDLIYYQRERQFICHQKLAIFRDMDNDCKELIKIYEKSGFERI